MTTVNVTAESFGRSATRGALIEIGSWLLLGSGIVAVVSWARADLGYGWDATDDRTQAEHSQMHLRVDHGTGCQYLESAAGSLAPRLDRAGRQVCR